MNKANVTVFLLECPACGRRLETPVHFLGKGIACPHCGKRFLAQDPSLPKDALDRAIAELLEGNGAGNYPA